ncbi:MAG: hypothetical protein ACRDOE_14120 [Streptosporangiaceae bacterium]
MLTVPEPGSGTGPQSAGELRAAVEQRDRWALDLAGRPGAAAHFWYYSRDSEEPCRGRCGIDAGEDVAMAVGIAGAIAALHRALTQTDPGTPAAALLLARPELRHAAQRINVTAALPYGEVHDNLLGAGFLPLQLQRFQLSTYGAENFLPQATDWIRVTLMQGAYSRHELPALSRWHHPLFPLPPRDANEDMP